MTSTQKPYLSPDDRVKYLYERNYFPAGSLTDSHIGRLGYLNFHYYLGYARNYRVLVDSERIPGPKDPDDVFGIIDLDHELSELLYSSLRKAEWNLRAAVVEKYSDKYDPYETFLDHRSYEVVDSGHDPRGIVGDIVSSVLRYGEPYVASHLSQRSESSGLTNPPKRYDSVDHDSLVGLVRGLPLWSVIDSFSLGLLSRFIERCDTGEIVKDRVWGQVAEHFEIPKKTFLTNLQALTVLRNLVSHHSRLWMRPMPISPYRSRMYKRQLRDVSQQAMMVNFYNLALFQSSRSERDELINAVEAITARSSCYGYGIKKVSGA
ncbi:MAG TPA: Abi family protein [Corynebacterium amycolatum]|nr:Abi family protein [Corynebacterium amycolatum]